MKKLVVLTTQVALGQFVRSTIKIDGYQIDNVTEQGCVQRVIASVEAGRGGWVWTPNVDMLRQCSESAELMRESDIVIADGMPLVWVSHLQGTPLPERVAGSNVIWLVSEAAAQRGYSVFFLGGGHEDTAPRAAKILQEKYPGLKVVGTYYPPFGFEKGPAQYDNMVAAISDAKPNIVFFALSYPKGEFLVKNIRLRCPPTVWMGIGISLSYITREVEPPAVWIQNAGLEWVHRMIQEPKRMYARYLWHDVPYALGMLARALRSKRLVATTYLATSQVA